MERTDSFLPFKKTEPEISITVIPGHALVGDVGNNYLSLRGFQQQLAVARKNLEAASHSRSSVSSVATVACTVLAAFGTSHRSGMSPSAW